MFGLAYAGKVEGEHAFVVVDPLWRAFWCEDAVAVTLCRTMIFKSPRFFQSLSVRAHEAAHVAQSRREGFIRFPLLYSWETHKNGYYKNRFEVDARRAARWRVRQVMRQLQDAGLVVRRVSYPWARRRTQTIPKDPRSEDRISSMIFLK